MSALERKRASNRAYAARLRQKPEVFAAHLAKRRGSNAKYYARIKADPEKIFARREKERLWKRANRMHREEQRGAYYERERSMLLFKQKLGRWLAKIRRAVIDNGGVPYDG